MAPSTGSHTLSLFWLPGDLLGVCNFHIRIFCRSVSGLVPGRRISGGWGLVRSSRLVAPDPAESLRMDVWSLSGSDLLVPWGARILMGGDTLVITGLVASRAR